MEHWIPVTKKLPRGKWGINYPHLSQRVLVKNSCVIQIGFYNRNTGLWYVGLPQDDNWVDKITHWKPLK
jgi:hypothetical protein